MASHCAESTGWFAADRPITASTTGPRRGLLLSITLTAKGLTFDQPLGEVTLPDPTQIAYDGKRLLIVADSGWATLDKADFVRTQGAPIIAIPLSKDCKPI